MRLDVTAFYLPQNDSVCLSLKVTLGFLHLHHRTLENIINLFTSFIFSML